VVSGFSFRDGRALTRAISPELNRKGEIMKHKLLKKAAKFPKEIKLQLKKPETRTSVVIEKVVKVIEEKLRLLRNNKSQEIYLLALLCLHDILKNLPSLVALIHFFHSS